MMKRSELAAFKKANNTPVWLKNMNAEQTAAINHTTGPIAVLAQAGSGKTRALVHRIVRLVEEGHTTPERILAVTFSKKAADEMSERAKRLGVDAKIGTWHALCLQIIKEDHLPQSKWAVDEQDKAKYILKNVIGYKQMNWTDCDLNELRSFISWCKACLYECNSIEAKKLADEWYGVRYSRLACTAYELYERMLEQEQLLTFDDFLVVVHRHLKANQEARDRWASQWEFIMQDEAQDSNPAQIAIARLLAQSHRNYLIVGDPAQSIYGFRGSSPEHIMNFVDEWNAERVVMNCNYRSADSIIECANNVIRKAAVRLETDMKPMRGFTGTAETVVCEDLDDEGNKFAQWVIEGVEVGALYSDYTCLFRTNAQSRAIEESLLKQKIPYVVVGGSSFYERKEVRDLLAYLRVAANQDKTGENIRRCINAPFRFLGAKFVDKLMHEATKKGAAIDWLECVHSVANQTGVQHRQKTSAIQWGEMMGYVRALIDDPNPQNSENKPEQILQHILQVTEYQSWLEKEEGQEGLHNNPVSNVRELVRVAGRFDTVQTFLQYIDKNIEESRKQRKDAQAGGNRVLLMSVHRSKGLEWPNVWIVGCNQGILPHAKGDIEEERRLAYVAMTRARDNLRCSYVKNIVQGAAIKELPVSEFLIDSGLCV